MGSVAKVAEGDPFVGSEDFEIRCHLFHHVRVRRAWATGGFRVGNRGLGRAENNGVSTSVTKDNQGKTAERESGLASL